MTNEQRQLEYLSIGDLRFDPENPRVPPDVLAGGDEAVLFWLLTDGNIVELMGSIGSQGYFAGEPLLVSSEGDRLTVVEGNRRLAACRLLLDPEAAPVKRRSVAAAATEAEQRPEVLPCLVFDSRDEILDFLGYRHITGIREWDPHAKARYLRQLFDRELADSGDELHSLRRVARRIGSRSDYVAKTLTSLALYEVLAGQAFFHLAGVSEDSLDFSFLTVGLNRPQIVEYLGLGSGQDYSLGGLDEGALRWFSKWVFEEDDAGRSVLGESRFMSRLAAVVADPVATELLQSGSSLEDAWLLAKDPTDDLTLRVERARGELVSALTMLELGHDPTPDLADVLEAVCAVATEILDLLNGLPDGD